MAYRKTGLEKQVDDLREPFAAFIRAQTTASIFLMLALFVALLLANSRFAQDLESIRHFHLGLVIGQQTIQWSLLHLVNDGLIALFFFLIGLEVKRELLAGELQDRSRVGLLISAAIGGMVVPAGLYLALNLSLPGGVISGWGIPMATDTAIAMGVLAALAARVSRTVVAFLVGVAIIDDIGAILVIAVVYTEQLNWNALATAGLLLVLLLILNRAGFRHPYFYALVGIGLWMAIVQSGIHASIAGVIVAASVPARPRIEPDKLEKKVRTTLSDVNTDAKPIDVLGEAQTHRKLVEVENLAQVATTPLRRWEDSLELPVMLFVLPLFAFLNAGIVIDAPALQGLLANPVAIGIMAGLVIGKPVGILLGVWLGESLGIAKRPVELTYRKLLGAGLLAGIGFTMSTFIAHLALQPQGATLESAKLAIVVSSAIAAVVGYVVLRFCSDGKN